MEQSDRPENDRPEIDRRVLRDIQEVGWHVVKVMEDEEGPAHAFTLGLHERFGHPEIVVVGPELEVMHQLLNALGERVATGQRFGDGGQCLGVLAELPLAFRSVAKQHYPSFLGYAGWYYQGAEFPALQCLWPDPEGHFPGEDSFHPDLQTLQPLLAEQG